MENKQFKVLDNVTSLEQMKGFAEAMAAFFEQLLILNKSLDTMAKDTKDIKEYFTLANGFQKDSTRMQEDLIEKLLEKMKDDREFISAKIVDNGDLVSKTVYNKVLGLAFGATGTISLIFGVVQNFLLNSSVKQIVEEVIKQIK